MSFAALLDSTCTISRESGILIRTSMPSLSTYASRSRLSSRSRFTTTPKGTPISRTRSTASERSYRPNGVGSVTSRQ